MLSLSSVTCYQIVLLSLTIGGSKEFLIYINLKLNYHNFRHSFFGGIFRLITLGLVVVSSFLLIWSPWLSSPESLMQVVHRIFPIYRGIFEDKVSNVWCIVNVFKKIK